MAIIYKVSLNGIIKYIGISSNSLENRKKSHLKQALIRDSKYVIHKAIRKYGNLLKWDVLETVPTWEDACKKEIELIKLFNTHVSYGGYNLTYGGEGQLGVSRKWTEEQKNKLRGRVSPMRGKKFPAWVGEKISKSRKGQPSGRSRKIIDNFNNIFESITAAAKFYGVKRTTINANLTGQNPKNSMNLHFQYLRKEG